MTQKRAGVLDADDLGAVRTTQLESRERDGAIGGVEDIGDDDRALDVLRGREQLVPRSGPAADSARKAKLDAALRRSGRRSAARTARTSARLAHRCGALPIAERAQTELTAAGARPRRVFRTGLDSLTPSERRVAALAAAGLSNADIAARLFITIKTVEHHLAAISRKLDIRSRRDLPDELVEHRPR